jgi:hypothetical protein
LPRTKKIHGRGRSFPRSRKKLSTVTEGSYFFGRNFHGADDNTCRTFTFYTKQSTKMAKRNAAAAAASSKSKHYKGDPISYQDNNVEGPIISNDELPASHFRIVLEMLSRINNECNYYNYQVCLQPSQELYDGIGTFSTLFDLDESNTFSVLKDAGLVGVDNSSKPFFKTQQWDVIAQNIPDFSWVKNYGRKKAFIFGIGSKGTKLSMASQYREKQGQRKFSRTCRQRQEEFNQKWKAVMDSHMSNEETRSPPDEDARLFQVSDRSASQNPDWTLHFDDVEEEDIVPSKKRQRKERDTMLGNQLHNMPVGWKACHNLHLQHLEEMAKVVKDITTAASKKKCHPTEEQRIVIGTFAARWPNVSDTAFEQVLSAGGIQLASQTSLFHFGSTKSILEFDDIGESLEPSRTSVTNAVLFTAAHMVIVNAERLAKSKKVYLGCDKGGGVLIKMAFFWDVELGKIVELNLDFDKSGDKAKDGGLAIQHSLEKYTFGDRQWNISGGSSDSGGGFTGAAMKKALVDCKLVDEEGYIHINCTHHNDQTNLRVSIETVFGSGGKEKRNVCQLVHAFSDMQKLFDKHEIHPIMEYAWKFVMGNDADMPSDFLTLMQEPILTRWGTVGEACRYVEKFRAVLISLAHGLCGSTTKSSNLAMCAGNFKSLANEDEIRIDLAFLSDFDKIFFRHEMEFNHSTDPNIGRPGFVANHHLVRYFLKLQALEDLSEELENGSVDQSPFNAKLKSFWARILEGNQLSSKERSLKKARRFLVIYLSSLAKHNAQFVSPDLLFLATFGEFETGTMVAKMLIQCAIETTEQPLHPFLGQLATFKSAIHQQDINLVKFEEFLKDMCWKNAQAAIQQSNFVNLVEDSVSKIAGGVNVWNGAEATKMDRDLYLMHFGALPSTAEMVERAVKKAKLCQKTGKGERNVTAYGIAGDGLKEACAEQLVVSSYATRMSENRKDQKRRAEEAGHEARSKNEYKEDLSRGPSCIRNTMNHALYLNNKVWGIRMRIGAEEYDVRFRKTMSMLTSLDQQGSAARYSKSLAAFELAVANPNHAAGPRELETGVTETSDSKGEIRFFRLRADTHVPALRYECFVRELGTEQELGDLGYRPLCKLIKDQNTEKWLDENRGMELPEDLKKAFFPCSNADFGVVR